MTYFKTCMRCTRVVQSEDDLASRVQVRVRIGLVFSVEVNLCPPCQLELRKKIRGWILDRPEEPTERRNLIL